MSTPREVHAIVLLYGEDKARLVPFSVAREGVEDVPSFGTRFGEERAVHRARVTVLATDDASRDGRINHLSGTEIWEVYMHHHMPFPQEVEKYVVYYTRRDQPTSPEGRPIPILSDIAVFRQALNRAGIVFTSVKEREDKFGLHGVFCYIKQKLR